MFNIMQSYRQTQLDLTSRWDKVMYGDMRHSDWGLGSCYFMEASSTAGLHWFSFWSWWLLQLLMQEWNYWRSLRERRQCHHYGHDTSDLFWQDALLNLVFTVAAFSLQGSMFFTGALFDYFGTRFTRLFLQWVFILQILTLKWPRYFYSRWCPRGGGFLGTQT